MSTSEGEILNHPHVGGIKLPPRPQSIKSDDRQDSESRALLLNDMNKLRATLTVTEQSFLESLAAHGDEIEVQIARKRLNDVTIFFHSDEEKEQEDLPKSQSDFGDAIAIGKTEDQSPRTLSPLKLGRINTLNSCASSHASRRSSVKMQKHFHSRRSSGIHEQMWLAHENGIAVTSSASRKSVVRRAASMGARSMNKEQAIRNNSFLSTATQDLLLAGGPMSRQGEDEVFRNSNNSLRSRIDEMSPDVPRSIMRLPEMPAPLGMGSRMRSDGSRRSVSFGHGVLPPSHRGARPSPRIPKRMMRELSMDSLGSESGALSATSTIESYPALHKAQPVRSDSISSLPSLHKGHPLRSDSALSVASLRRPLPIRSDSVSSAITTDDPAWVSPLNQNDTKNFQSHPAATKIDRPTLLRLASKNAYQGEGIEVTQWDNEVDNIGKARNFASMLSLGDNSVLTTGSWDETANREDIFRDVRFTLSDDHDLANYFLGDASKFVCTCQPFAGVAIGFCRSSDDIYLSSIFRITIGRLNKNRRSRHQRRGR